jgi:Glycine/D-amino acid oxidases (deaminating)
MTSPSSSYDVAVVGGGVIGLSVAWRLGKGGLSVALIDPDPGRGVSSIAAGMLGPTTTRSPYAEKELQRFNATSAAAYPAFITELEKSSGMRVGYECSGAVLIAVETAMAEKNSALSPPVGVERHSDGAGFVESVYKYQSGYRARIRNHGHSCFLCEIVIRSQFHTTYEPEA